METPLPGRIPIIHASDCAMRRIDLFALTNNVVSISLDVPCVTIDSLWMAWGAWRRDDGFPFQDAFAKVRVAVRPAFRAGTRSNSWRGDTLPEGELRIAQGEGRLGDRNPGM